jgi:uncharacterized membrane protein YqjE
MSLTTGAHRAVDDDHEPSLGALVKDASASFSTILRGEIELAKLELRSSVKNAGVGLGFFAVAGAVIFFSMFFLFFAFGWGLAALGLPIWGAFLIVFGVLFGVGALAGLLGFLKVRRVRPPTRTIETTKDTVAYLKDHPQRA